MVILINFRSLQANIDIYDETCVIFELNMIGCIKIGALNDYTCFIEFLILKNMPKVF